MTEQPAHRAAKDGDVGALRRVLENGVSPNVLAWQGRTPLYYLCDRHGGDAVVDAEAQVACVRMLLEAGANVNASDQYQMTPLHFAANCGHAKVVAALLEAGADVNRSDSFGMTPLHWACARYDSEVEPAKLLEGQRLRNQRVGEGGGTGDVGCAR